MSPDEILQAYANMVSICSKIDYNDPKTVRANNNAVRRMYLIADQVVKISWLRE